MAKRTVSAAGTRVKLANKARAKGRNKRPVKRLQSTRTPRKARQTRDTAAPAAQTASGTRHRLASESNDSDDDDVQDQGLASYERRIRPDFHNLATQDMEDMTDELPAEPATRAISASEAPAKVSLRPKPLIDLIVGRRRMIMEYRGLVGGICVAVIANPERNVKRLKALIALLDLRKEDAIFKLAFLKLQSLVAYSLLEVFRDILPSYRLKEDDGSRLEKRLKKETRELQEYEATLLKDYRTYLNKLQRMSECVKKKKSSSFYDAALTGDAGSKEKIAVVGTRCLCNLMLANTSFNYAQVIIESVVPLMSSRLQSLREVSFDSVVRLFREDKTGQVSMMAVKCAGKVIKAQKLAVHPLLLHSFLHLRIKEVTRREDGPDMKAVRERQRKQSKQERKQDKAMLKLRSELKEADAREDQNKKIALHTQILDQIFFVYFRFIKDFIELAEEDVAKNSAIMTPVLEGLGKFAHLINIDFFDDLIALLFRLVVCKRLSDIQMLFCLKTVFTILSGEGAAIAVDPQRFYARFYVSLLHFDVTNDDDSFVTALVECFDKMLLQRKRQVTLSRVLAFSKRLATITVQTSCKASAVCLFLLHSLLHQHSKADLLTDTEHFGSGTFQAEVEEPEFCNATAARLWELHLLRTHYDPCVGRFADTLLRRSHANASKRDFLSKTADQVYAEISSRNNLEHVFSDDLQAKLAGVKRRSCCRPHIADLDYRAIRTLLVQGERQ